MEMPDGAGKLGCGGGYSWIVGRLEWIACKALCRVSVACMHNKLGARNASIYLITLIDAPFLGGDLRWPNGPWPGEKIPYFTAKTGHMARHGIWPSDRISLRWARWVKPCHGLARWGAGCPARQMARRGPCVLTGGACTQHPLNRLGNAVSSSGAAGTGK